jgi:hypothetical protein
VRPRLHAQTVSQARSMLLETPAQLLHRIPPDLLENANCDRARYENLRRTRVVPGCSVLGTQNCLDGSVDGTPPLIVVALLSDFSSKNQLLNQNSSLLRILALTLH